MKADIDDFIIYLSSEKGASKNTLEAYKRDILSFHTFLLNKQIDQWTLVRQEHLIGYLALKRDQQYATASICRAFIAIKGLFRFLKRESLITSNFTLLMDSPKLWQLIPDVLTQEEMERILAQPDKATMKGVRDRAILEVLYGCGLRVSELCGLKIQDVDDEYVKIKGKGGKERIVPIGTKAIAAIDHYLSLRDGCEVEALFLNKRNRAINRMRVWKLVKHYAKQAEIRKPIFPHTFRHSYATHLLDNGADLRVIQELLGHANISSTDRYTHVSCEKLQSAFNNFHPRK